MTRSDSNRPPRVDWGAAPWVFLTLATCPHCGSPSYRKTKTIAAGEGAATRRVLCRACDKPYQIYLALPETGESNQ